MNNNLHADFRGNQRLWWWLFQWFMNKIICCCFLYLALSLFLTNLYYSHWISIKIKILYYFDTSTSICFYLIESHNFLYVLILCLIEKIKILNFGCFCIPCPSFISLNVEFLVVILIKIFLLTDDFCHKLIYF